MAEKLTKEDIIKAIESMSVLDLNDLVGELEEKFGVSAQPMAVPVASNGAAESVADGAEEKTEFDVVLAAAGDNKIGVIKAVRSINQNLGLKEAKDAVESTPATLLEGVSKDDAEAAKKQLEEAGAKVELK